MQYLDINMWLMGDILLKADKTSMANSLELRVPFLDKEMLKLAETIPLDCRVSTKFPVPIRVWLKEEGYYNRVKAEFTSENAEKFFDTARLLKLLDVHKAGKADNSRKIWTVYTFLVWYKQFFAA